MRYLVPILVLLLVIPGMVFACKGHKQAPVPAKTYAYPTCGGCAQVMAVCQPVWNPPAVVSPIYDLEPYCCPQPMIRNNCCGNCGARFVAHPKTCQPNVYYMQKQPVSHPTRSCGVDVNYAPCDRVHYRAYYRR
jgi:hypothetical protein